MFISKNFLKIIVLVPVPIIFMSIPSHYLLIFHEKRLKWTKSITSYITIVIHKENDLLPKEKDYGQLLRILRKRLGLTQEKLAAKLDVTFASVNRWENRRVKPSRLAVKQIEKFVRSLGEDVKDLVSGYFEE